MGWHFSIADANVVAWVTAPPGLALELDGRRAHELLCDLGLAYDAEYMGFVSSDHDWLVAIYEQCRDYQQRSRPNQFDGRLVEDELRRFRDHFRDTNLFALGVANSRADHKRMRAFMEHGAYSSGPHALFLIPDEVYADQTVSLMQPFPAFSLLANCPGAWPGVLFWTRNAVSAFASLEQADELYHELLPHLSNAPAIDQILSRFCRMQARTPVLLQLSDLHYGASEASRSQEYLYGEVQRIAKDEEIRRILITGDLFDQPKREHARAFNFLRSLLHQITGTDPIVIPGNHDQRVWGMFPQKLEELADLEWSALITDDDLRIHFVCFDSSRDANLARGKVDDDQRLQVATRLAQRLAQRPETEDYRRIALIHHHPFSFEVPPGEFWWRLAHKIGITEESFLKMENGDEFVRWCAERGVSLILHGHKHVPYRVSARVHCRGPGGQDHVLTVDSIGCGSSTGAGNLPLSINCIYLDVPTGKMAVRFLDDPGDGRGFKQRQIAVVPTTITATG